MPHKNYVKEITDKPAVINSETAECYSQIELEERSSQLAQFMWEKGLRKGDHIAIFMENDIRYFEVIMAAFRSGLFITPVNRYLTAEEAGFIVDNCDAKVLIASAKLADVQDIVQYAPNCSTRLCIHEEIEGFLPYEETIAAFSPTPLDQQPLGSFMYYSSGTTGRPKGIMRPAARDAFEDAAETHTLQTAFWGFGPETVYLSPAPLYHASPSAFCMATLLLGGTVVMMPKFDEAKALEAIEKYQVTHSQWVPTMFTRMLRLPDDVKQGYDLSSHKVALHAAAPCPQGIKHQMIEWWGPIIHEYYGGSELNGMTVNNSQEWLANPGTVGKAILGTLHICDDDGNEVPTGDTGLVYFEQPVLPFSYYKDEKQTRSACHPVHENWSALGDVGYMNEEGFLFLTDRASFMIISGGVNIYPQEIEDAMILHENVADVAVFGVPNKEMGEEVKAVVQLIDGTTQTEETSASIMDFTRERIAHYKCPRSIDFIEELPRLPTGKLYKRLLKDKYWGKTDSRIV